MVAKLTEEDPSRAALIRGHLRGKIIVLDDGGGGARSLSTNRQRRERDDPSRHHNKQANRKLPRQAEGKKK